MGVTAFGKILRKRRIDSSEILGDMAKRLDVSAAYLSSIENGLREIPESFVEKIAKEYGLSEAEKQEQAILRQEFIASFRKRSL